MGKKQSRPRSRSRSPPPQPPVSGYSPICTPTRHSHHSPKRTTPEANGHGNGHGNGKSSSGHRNNNNKKPLTYDALDSAVHIEDMMIKNEAGGISCDDSSEDEAEQAKSLCKQYSISTMYGIINATVVLPVMMSFATIIYHDKIFEQYLPVLVKLTLVSSAVHQLCFSFFSSMPYAVGQVQDAGLIFLSSISTSLVKYCEKRDKTNEEILATTTIGLSLCTAFLGFGLLCIGKCRLASYVQYLPTSVVGGYLAYIGFFCGQSGLALMSDVQVSGITQWWVFFTPRRLTLLLPGLFGGVGIYVCVRTIRHMSVLPLCMLLIIASFYAILFLTGTSTVEAREYGWLGSAEPAPPFLETWEYLNFSGVVWSALPGQFVTLCAMTLVVALSSCLDIAAIELELGQDLNYDHELITVGTSNMMSGLTGGYTGSYIFSQTIFSLRSGVRDRICGFTIALLEMVVVIAPFPIVSYVPKLFFGSLLVMICVDLMYEWLWAVRKKINDIEYFVAVVSFLLIMLTGVEWGIVAGIILNYLCTKFWTIEEGEKGEGEGENETTNLLL